MDIASGTDLQNLGKSGRKIVARKDQGILFVRREKSGNFCLNC